MTKNSKKPIICIDDIRNQKILESISEKFILQGFPIEVISKSKNAHKWLRDLKLLENNLDICKFIVDFVAYEMPEMHEVFNPIRAGLVGGIIIEMIQTYGCFSDEFTIVYDKDNADIQCDEMVDEETRADRQEPITADEAVKQITKIYDVDLAMNGESLRFSNKTKQDIRIYSGLLPILMVSAIIQEKLDYSEPECELILDVTKKLYELAKAKKDKPYILSSDEIKEHAKTLKIADYTKEIRESLR